MDLHKHSHFKLYVLLEDSLTFERELDREGIEYYSDAANQIGSSHSIRYYLKEEDGVAIDRIVKEFQIQTGIESTGLNRFYFNSKPLRTTILWVIGFLLFIWIVSYVL